MIARLHMAAMAATLSALTALTMTVPALAADAHGDNAGYRGHIADFETVEIIRADTRHGGRNDNWRGGGDRHYAHRSRHLDPWQVRGRLHRQGFHNIHFVDRWAPVYKLRATGPRGRRVFLVVSSRSGNIIDRRPIGRGHWR